MSRLACYDTVATGIGLGGVLSGATKPAQLRPAEPESASPADAGVTPEPPSETLSTPDPEPRGKWMLSRSINPIDDSKTVMLTLTADTGVSSRGTPISMIARCQSNKTELFVNWNDYLGDDSNDVYEEWKLVTVRVADAPAVQQRWSISTDNDSTFAPDWAGSLLKTMLDADRMILQTIPYNESPVTATFDIRGLRGSLKPLAETCGWSYE